MTHPSRRSFFLAAGCGLLPVSLAAQRRRTVVVARPRPRIVVRPGHPVARAVNRTVVVRAPRRTVVVGAPLVFLPAVAFVAAAATLPSRERLIWQDTETIHRDEDWVESNFGVDEKGDALYLEINGRAQLDFADITYGNGEVQVVDFNENTLGGGIHRLHDFAGRRVVKTVRLVARSKSEDTVLRIYLSA